MGGQFLTVVLEKELQLLGCIGLVAKAECGPVGRLTQTVADRVDLPCRLQLLHRLGLIGDLILKRQLGCL